MQGIKKLMINETSGTRVKKCFFGCNSAHGFHSFFDFFHDLNNAKISIVKGGPGTGKSTFIGSIANAMLEKGYDIELQYCSLDANSLDALVVPAIKAVVVAATGHHVFDPRNPGAVDEIINLGSFWNEDGIREHTRDILSINKESDRFFRKVYRYLESANLIKNNMREIYTDSQNFSQVNKLTAEIGSRIFNGYVVGDRIGSERHLFVNSITPEGYLSFVDTTISRKTKIIVVLGESGTGRSTMFGRMADMAKIRGLKVEYYHNPLDFNRIEHLLIPDLNILLTSENSFFELNEIEFYDLNDYLSDDFNKKKEEIDKEKEKYDAMMDTAIESLKIAKETHGKLEGFYISNMDFDGVDRCRKNTIENILKHGEKFGLSN